MQRRRAAVLTIGLAAILAVASIATPQDTQTHYWPHRTFYIPVNVERINQSENKPTHLQLYSSLNRGQWQAGAKLALNGLQDLDKFKRFNWEAARTKIPDATSTNVLTNAGVNCPTGRARVAVRGLAASIEASARRLNAMAAERAETMATTIHPSCRHAGKPPAASMAPQSANGSAKIECSHLIISSVIFRFPRRPTRQL